MMRKGTAQKLNNQKLKQWFIDNKIVIIYFIFAFFIDVIGVFAVEKSPIISKPFILIGFLLFVSGIALQFKSNIKRFVFCIIFIVVQAFFDLAFVVVYDMTGQYFDYGMLKLRNDAFGMIESIPMNFIAFYSAIFFCVFYILYGIRIVKRRKKVEKTKARKFSYIAIMILGLIVMSSSLYRYNSKKVDKYQIMLKNTQMSMYSSYGIMGNLLNEFSKGLVFHRMDEMSVKQIEKFIYEEVSEPTDKFGISEDNNVIVLLSESFEWFTLLNSEEYPNGHNFTDEEIEYLFPNLSKFYNESVVATNFHSKEKTDISESISILGSYPTSAYINYDYPENVIPHTVPNILREKYGDDISINSFHNGFKTFYNRIESHKIFGFEKLTDMYDMYDMSDKFVESGKAKEPTMIDYMNNGQRNLDSQMINTAKDIMFPTDKKFYTYITTITMHGLYYERENLTDEREKLKKIYKLSEDATESEKAFMNYLTTAMDYDEALGMMMEDLEKKNLLDNTTIILFSDHNAYYQQLSNYVKDIYDYDTENYYTDLYNVPLMIYDKNLEHQIVDKFMCTADIVPTLLDLLGIRYYTNMYYGNSMFSEKESVMYSRAYAIFVGDGVVGQSLNSISFRDETVTDEYMEYFNSEAKKLVEKIKYCDQLFYQDYFATEKNYNKFMQKMKEIN